MLRFLIFACSVLGVFSQVVDFGAISANINENAGMIEFEVELNTGVAAGDITVVLEVLATGTAAAGHDFDGTGPYTVMILNGQDTGTLTIAVKDDMLVEPMETIELGIMSVTGGGGATPGTTTQSATTTITPDADSVKVKVDFSQSIYETDEAATVVTVGIEFTDPAGQPTVLNGADMLTLGLPTASSVDTATAGADYVDPTAPAVTLTFDVTATSQTLTPITVIDDDDHESTEVFYLSLASITTGTYVEVGTTRAVTQVRIRDNDVESLICVARPEIFRRSLANVEFYAFASLPADRDSIAWSKRNYETGALTNVGANGKKLTVARPGKRSSRRFGYYTFTVTGNSGASLSCHNFLRSKSDILNYPGDVARKYSMVIYPATEGGTTLSPALRFGIDYDPPSKRNKIKWEKDNKRISQTSPTIRVTTIDAAGVYTISRDKRGDRGNGGKSVKGWFAIIELIASVCPVGQYDAAGCTACGTCYNGGICDTTFGGRCICPPCFEGDQCELVATDVGSFGQTTRFSCAVDLGLPITCEGALFTFQGRYGSSCGCGWFGSDCKTECKEGTFGADCSQTCHCMTVANCNKRTGVCSDRICETGYGGENCQLGSTP